MRVQLTEENVNTYMQKMNEQAMIHRQEKFVQQTRQPERLNKHLVIIGGGMAGLAAAQVAARYFTQVTLVERDEAAGSIDFRSGVPQARHTHNLLPEGLEILERLFPGIISELILSGGVPVSVDEQYIYAANNGRAPLNGSGRMIYASRPLVEAALYKRLAVHPEIQILKGWDVSGLEIDPLRGTVTAACLRKRGEKEMILPADLVLDTSGRNSKAIHWLADAGYETPRETRVDAFTGYASRIYQKPAGFSAPWKMLYIAPSTPDQTRGGIILPLEGNRWHVTLLGMAKDYPPTDEEGFLAFAKSLLTDELYNAIRQAEPITKPSGYRLTQNRRLHYERLPRFIEGLFVAGDAVMSLNPVYAQGMTKALIEIQVFDRLLAENRKRIAQGNMESLSRSFQTEISRAASSIWRMATDEDTCWPETMIIEGYSLDRRVLPSCRRKMDFAPRVSFEMMQSS